MFRACNFSLSLCKAQKEALFRSKPTYIFSPSFFEMFLICFVADYKTAEVSNIFSEGELSIDCYLWSNMVRIKLRNKNLPFLCKVGSVFLVPPTLEISFCVKL